jgi:hypothetical protein
MKDVMHSVNQMMPDNGSYPCVVWNVSQHWDRRDEVTAGNQSTPGTYYGATDSDGFLVTETGTYPIKAGMFFSLTDLISLDVTGTCALICLPTYKGQFYLGGPIEDTGRLKYIDGCTDTLLIGPMKIGDPCLNHLHFPIGINQTMHTHESVRCGLIIRGHGWCNLPDQRIELVKGMVWLLPEGSRHAFQTTDSSLDVIAWHPDTDMGPSDEDHPMLNRTYVAGVSAKLIDDIRTK